MTSSQPKKWVTSSQIRTTWITPSTHTLPGDLEQDKSKATMVVVPGILPLTKGVTIVEGPCGNNLNLLVKWLTNKFGFSLLLLLFYKTVRTSVLKALTKRIYLVHKLVYVIHIHRECTPKERNDVICITV